MGVLPVLISYTPNQKGRNSLWLYKLTIDSGDIMMMAIWLSCINHIEDSVYVFTYVFYRRGGSGHPNIDYRRLPYSYIFSCIQIFAPSKSLIETLFFYSFFLITNFYIFAPESFSRTSLLCVIFVLILAHLCFSA